MAFDSQSRGPRSNINVTPLVDVVLVLLIIFMVVTPLLHRGKKVRLPAARHALEEKPGQGPVVVSVPADKTIWWGNSRVTLDELEMKVREAMLKESNTKILLKADDTLPVGAVRPAIDRLRQAGARDLVLAADLAKGTRGGTR